MSVWLLISSIIYPPIGIMGLIGLAFDFNNWKKYIVCITIFISTVAYCYNPLIETDLIRYFEYIKTISKMPFGEALYYDTYGLNDQGLIVFTTCAWIIGKIGDVHIISAISVFGVYYVELYVLCSVGHKLHISSKKIIAYIIVLLLATNFYSIVNNVRNVFSFSLISLAVYRDCCQRKRNIITALLYVLPVFVHPTAILLLLLRLALLLKGVLKNVCIVGIIVSRLLVIFLYAHIDFFEMHTVMFKFSKVIKKAYNYFFTVSKWGLIVQASPSERLFKFLYISMAVVIGICAYIVSNDIKKNYVAIDNRIRLTGLSKLNEYVMFLGLITFECIPMLAPEYWRFSAICIILSGLTYCCGECFWTPDSKKRSLLFLLFVFPLMCFPLWMRNLIRYCDSFELVTSFMTTSPVWVIGRIVKALIIKA